MVKRKPSIKSDTVIKVVALGILGYIGLKAIPSLSDGGSGGYGGYSDSGTDLSAIPSGFFTDTPPIFNIDTSVPDGFFSTPMIPNTDTENATTKKEFEVLRNPVEVVRVGNTTNSNWTNIFNPDYWLGSVGKDLSTDEYNLRVDNYSRYSIFKNEQVKALGGSIMVNIIPFPFNLLLNAGSVAGGCSNGSCQTYDGNSTKKDFTVEVTTNTFSQPISLTPSNNTASSLIANLRNNSSTPNVLNNTWGANPVLSRIKNNEYLITNSQNMPRYYDYSKKSMVIDYSDVERAIQSNIATTKASGNCGPAIITNACNGTKKSVNYANTPSSSTRYYENKGTSLTRSDLTVSF